MDFDPRYDTSPVVSYGQVHVKLFTVFKISGLPGLAMFHLKVLENSPLLQSYPRRLSRFSENLTTLSLMVLHSVGLNDVKLSTVKKVDFKNTKCKFCKPRLKRM